ncbi:MAG: tyrosine-type recombinase/integrase [Nannocystaceae bacterium]
MKITLRPYPHDTSRWHVDIRLMNPCNPDEEIRKRKVAPAGLSEAQARAWGERQVPKIIRKVLGADAPASKEVLTTRTRRQIKEIPAPTPDLADAMTLAVFYAGRFEPEHIRLQKPATQASYEANFRKHILPSLGTVPLAAIDAGRILTLRAKLSQSLAATTVNLVLTHLGASLRFAVKAGLLAEAPKIEKARTPRPAPKDVLSPEEQEALLEAAAAIDPQTELLCLLGLHAGLRCSEICALEWSDIDLKAGVMTIRHNTYRGQKQTPKGRIGRLAISSRLRQALEAHRHREPIGPLVLYRRSHLTGGDWKPHTKGSLTHALKRAQRAAGIQETGPHLLRHTMLTHLADLGASVFVLQAAARHSEFKTTQRYLHMQRACLTSEAALLLDRASPGPSTDKTVAKTAKLGENDS